jgi:membrane-bound lytic murein transglycosylase B
MPLAKFLLPLLFAVPLSLLARGSGGSASSPSAAAPAGDAVQVARAGPRKSASAPRSGPPYSEREDAMRFADEVAAKRGLDRDWVRRTLGEAQDLAIVSRLVQPAPAAQPKNWSAYRSRFIEPVRIDAGVRFWQDNRSTLERAQRDYGVPPEIVVGILGVETIYGQQMGDFRIIDALATLAFDFPQNHPRAAERSQYFRGELEEFLAYTASHHVNPLKPRGSYAGAWGMPQFMPSSLEHFGVDYDGDGKVDLARSAADAIGSVANYFRNYGWVPGMPAYYPVRLDPAKLDLDALLAPDILPTFSVASFQAKGAVLEGPALQHKGPLALIELQNGGDPPTYVAGTENFYAITRYNWSSYYAMAVIELGQAVKEEIDRSAAGAGRTP